jgi:hypothetical protein
MNGLSLKKLNLLLGTDIQKEEYAPIKAHVRKREKPPKAPVTTTTTTTTS